MCQGKAYKIYIKYVQLSFSRILNPLKYTLFLCKNTHFLQIFFWVYIINVKIHIIVKCG